MSWAKEKIPKKRNFFCQKTAQFTLGAPKTTLGTIFLSLGTILYTPVSSLPARGSTSSSLGTIL